MFQSIDPRNSGLPLTAEAHRRLELELDRLRGERRGLADSLRRAREFGEPGGNDEQMAIREEEPIIRTRIARLEQILAQAHVVDGSGDGHTVAIGSHVTLLDQESGRTESYLIDGAHGSMESNVITAGSPMGMALIGRERGAVVRVELPNGRIRTFTILDLAHPAHA